jgi:S-DNA-T family DNA segregation ATPase FtsK/SpoIIIE
MASKSIAVDAQDVDPSPLLRLGWLIAAIVWCLVLAAMVSHAPGDAPGHALAPIREGAEVRNWIGPVGAAVSHHLFTMLGVGAWVMALSGGAWLAHVAWRGPISHVALRGVGVLLVALAASGFHALLWPGASRAPEGAGGLLAIVGVHELGVRFGALGTALWLVTLAAVGATVAFDRWLVIVPAALARGAGRVLGVGAAATTSARRGITGLAAMRANDVDDDRRLGRLHEFLRSAARRTGGPAEAIDEEEGGLGGASFDPERELAAGSKRRGAAAEAEPEGSDEEEWDEEELGDESDYEDEYEDDEAPEDEYEDEEAEALAEGGADGDRELSEDELREKIARLPVRFATASKKLASEDDLDRLRAQRASEEEADRNYVFPGLDLLTDPEENYEGELEEYIREQARALEHALATYRIDGHVAGVDSGPVITLYQVALAPGTKVSSVQAVSSDLARMLKATNIRIVPNTEGLDTIGIEVPNRLKEKVRLKELMASSESTARMRLPLFLGKDASGAPLIVDLAGLPHMLIAGTTGSGKSVCMNAILMGFLYTQKPSDLKLVLVDPKMVELSQFRDVPHLMCPVVTEMSKAAAILEWAVTKMDERYELLAEAGCRDITAYNALGWDELKDRLRPATELEEAKIPRKLPYIVFVIDELADMMMTNKEVETSIVRIAQKARAVGIHLILATQRPQANVVTGLIKSNMPGRVSFKVASSMDSRIVLDQKGGELLLGQGDMLMLTPRSSATIRAQGTLVDDAEIRRVVRFIRDHAGQNFEGALVQISNHGYEAQLHEDRMRESAQEDPLFDRAVELVLEEGRGSVSMLQRRLAIGYTRSARLIEMMGEAGIIGRHKGTVAREVNLTLEEWEAMKAIAEGGPEPGAAPGAQPTLFGDEPEVSGQEKAALLERAGFEARADEDGAEVSLVDTRPSATDRYANGVDADEDADARPVAASSSASVEAKPASADDAPGIDADVAGVGVEELGAEAASPVESEEVPAEPVAEARDAEVVESEAEEEAEAVAEADEPEADEELVDEAEEDAELVAEAEEDEAEDDLVAEAEEEDEEADEAPVDEAVEDEEEDDLSLVGEAAEDEAWGEAEADEPEDAAEEEDEEEYEEAESESEDAEEYEYEYEYVDEDGNPIDASELEDGEYEYVDADEEEAEDAVDEEKVVSSEDEAAPDRPAAEIRTRSVGWKGASRREGTGAS